MDRDMITYTCRVTYKDGNNQAVLVKLLNPVYLTDHIKGACELVTFIAI